MFGYVTADLSRLDEGQRLRYQSCYCGLCHTLRREGSRLCRLALNYDMVFLVLLLSSLYEPPEETGEARCAAHPCRARPYACSEWSVYGAAMSVILCHSKCLDDWRDERDLWKLAESWLFRPHCRRLSQRWPRQTEAIAHCLLALSELEASGQPEPDRAANLFAALMGELFVPETRDRWAGDLRAVGEGLGRFLYLVDAAVDLPTDLRRRRYNPLKALCPDGTLPAGFQRDLTVVLGEAAVAFERLPLVQDVGLLRNILYAGVWDRFKLAMDKRGARWEGEPL